MKVKFGDAEYNVANNYVDATIDHFNITIEKGEKSVDQVILDVQNAEEITTLDDEGEVMGVYRGYSEVVSIGTVDGSLISISLLNKDIKTQVDVLSETLAKVEHLQNVQEMMLDRVTTVVNILNNSQTVQDYAIEDLAAVVSDLIPQEG